MLIMSHRPHPCSSIAVVDCYHFQSGPRFCLAIFLIRSHLIVFLYSTQLPLGTHTRCDSTENFRSDITRLSCEEEYPGLQRNKHSSYSLETRLHSKRYRRLFLLQATVLIVSDDELRSMSGSRDHSPRLSYKMTLWIDRHVASSNRHDDYSACAANRAAIRAEPIAAGI